MYGLVAMGEMVGLIIEDSDTLREGAEMSEGDISAIDLSLRIDAIPPLAAGLPVIPADPDGHADADMPFMDAPKNGDDISGPLRPLFIP